MKKILFPTDFSTTANNALVYALKMADKHNATLYVLHAYEMPVISATANPVMVQDVYKTIELGKFENFKDQVPFIREIAEEHGLSHVPMLFILEEGFLNSIIKKCVKEEGIDLVVMGTNGNTGFDKKLLGSNTANAISSLHIPVLSIPHNAVFKGIQNIAFTTLFKDKDLAILDKLIPIAKVFDAEIQCLHISSEATTVNGYKLSEWRSKYKDEPISFHFITSKSVEEAIFEFMDDENIDLVVAVTRSRNFFEKLFSSSMTRKLSYHMDIPVLAFHEE